MRAVLFERHGGLEVLRAGTAPDPRPGPNDVVVAVRACALNHLDIWVRQGLPGIPIPLPHISGSDVAGTVLEWGKAVRRFKRGQRVIVSPGQTPLDADEAVGGRDSYSPDFRVLGLQTQGGYAEKVCVDARFVLPVSDRLSFEEWAAVPLVTLTAYHMLVTRAALRAGETVLVHAAGSGVGSVAVQLAKLLGARVFTTVGDRSKVLRAKRLGADEVILYREKNFADECRRLTSGRGVDVVFEHIGPEVWAGNLQSLARGGRMVTCGATSGPKAEIDLRHLFSKQLSILGSYMGSLAELKAALTWVESGALRPVLDRVYPLREAARAQRRMLERRNFGKIVLRVRA